MRSLRHLPPDTFRRVAAAAALLAQLVAATGAPVFARPGAGKAGGAPFPCQNHPCGCATGEQGWAGDCCCFTLDEKLAWADARGVTPPPHVRPAVEARRLARQTPSSCCAKKPAACCDRPTADAPEPARPAVRWVAGVFAQKCRGEGFGGLLKLELLSVPADPVPQFAPGAVEPVREADPQVTSLPSPPPTPPPRLA